MKALNCNRIRSREQKLNDDPYLVQLIEVSEDDGIISEVREQFLAHPPASLELLLPGEIATFAVWRALLVVTAEERVPSVADPLLIDPIIRILGVIAFQHAVLEILSPLARTQGGTRDGQLIRKNVVAPLGAQSPRKTHERQDRKSVV